MVSRKDTSGGNKSSFIDKSANGGLAGQDTAILHVTDCSVNVQNIDDHQMVNIPIVTAAGVVETQRRQVILIMNQYANVKREKSIYLSGQLEAHGNIVDDRAVPNGRKQQLVTHSGYTIPLQV